MLARDLGSKTMEYRGVSEVLEGLGSLGGGGSNLHPLAKSLADYGYAVDLPSGKEIDRLEAYHHMTLSFSPPES